MIQSTVVRVFLLIHNVYVLKMDTRKSSKKPFIFITAIASLIYIVLLIEYFKGGSLQGLAKGTELVVSRQISLHYELIMMPIIILYGFVNRRYAHSKLDKVEKGKEDKLSELDKEFVNLIQETIKKKVQENKNEKGKGSIE